MRQRWMAVAIVVASAWAVGCKPPVKMEGGGGQKDPGKTVPGLNSKNVVADATARAIVEAMFAAYANCKTYADTGTFVFEDTRMTFLTRYKRPDRIYFEFSAKNNARDGRFVYWAQGVRKVVRHNGVDGPDYTEDTVLTNAWYGDNGELETDESLGLAVAGFTGISLGTGATVPNMLFPSEIGTLCFSDMEDLKSEGTAMDRGVECDVVYSKKHLTRAWIDRKTHLLRRIAERFEEGEPEMVAEYLPKTNVEIKDELMVFVPPK